MLIVYGVYRFRPKRVAFRNDYCVTCKQEGRAIGIRTFDVGHIFGIPVLPVGFWKHWCCSSCSKDPHAHRGTGPSLKWAAILALITLAGLVLAQPGTPWIVRFMITVVVLVLLTYLLRSPLERSLKEKLAVIPAATDTTCPFCATPLVSGTRWSCPACGVVRC